VNNSFSNSKTPVSYTELSAMQFGRVERMKRLMEGADEG
jgi:hypothetical protein